MKKFLFALLFAAAMLPAAQAVAADLDVEPPPPPVADLRPATYDWSGLYVGGWIGAVCLEGTLDDNVAVDPWDNSGCGYKGGVMGGYNHQIDNLVLGVEADWGMSGKIVANSTNLTALPGDEADFGFDLASISTVRGKVGYAMDDTMFFFTGGGAWAKGHVYGINGAADPDNIKQNHFGWTLGGGIEHALTDSLRVRLDYLYTDFRSANYFSSTCSTACDLDIDFVDHEVRIGAIWAF